jgi:heptosyltransferase-2/heptosyltransferase-3
MAADPALSVVATEAALRPLVVRCGAMGDMVILLALIAALHRRFGTAVDVLSSGAWTRPLLEGQPGVGRLYMLGSRGAPWWLNAPYRRVVTELRPQMPQPTWVGDKGPFGPTLLRRAGIGSDWITIADRDCPLGASEHKLDRWLRFAALGPAALPPLPAGQAAMIAEGLRSPPLRVLPQWRADLAAWLHEKRLTDAPLYLIQAGNKRTMRWWAPRRRDTNTKYWPEDRWAAVIRALLDSDARSRVLLLGVPAEAALNDEIAGLVRSERVVNVARDLPIPRLLALQEHASGMISVDTGPAHSAAALDCPLVALFGEADVRHYFPRSPSGRVEALVGRAGDRPRMMDIGIEDVIAAWRRLVGGTMASPGSRQSAA